MWAAQFYTVCLLASTLCLSTHAYSHASDDFQNTDEDLELFVSRPDIRPPKFKVTKRHSHKSSAPGYLFLAPYVDLRSRAPSSLYAPGQTGPHIYDSDGTLIWSGAALYGERPTFDFKAASCNGQPCLTFILHENTAAEEYIGGAGIIMDTSFNVRDSISSTTGRGTMNMHEFTVTEQGTAMYITYSSTMTKVGSGSMFVGDNGFREVDIHSGKVLFNWWALDHVDPTESLVTRPKGPGSYGSPWDFFHMNSIDKNADGDYLISSRYLNAIFKVSGKDGSVIWQLGGSKTMFEMDDFTFSSQHNARFIEETSSHVVISFLNNAADDKTATARSSSAMYVRMDLKNMTATLLKKYNRPDQKLTRLRGNVQRLPNDNTLVSWSENGLISEFDSTGNCLFEGAFASHRFVTYRAYKYNLTTIPSESPAFVARVYSSSPNNSITAMYASWNGATDIASWKFTALNSDRSRRVSLGEVKKTGFETSLMVPGWKEQIVAEALDSYGNVLASSAITNPTLHAGTAYAADELKENSSQSSHEHSSEQINRVKSDGSQSQKPARGRSSRLRPLDIERDRSMSMNYLIILLTSSCLALAVGLGWAIYRIRVLTSGISAGASYLPVRSVSLA